MIISRFVRFFSELLGMATPAQLGSGPASSTTFLRGDQTWAAPPSGGGGAIGSPIGGADPGVVLFVDAAGDLAQAGGFGFDQSSGTLAAPLILSASTVTTGAGPTSSRPTGPGLGAQWFDTTLGGPIWFNGSTWISPGGSGLAIGAPVGGAALVGDGVMLYSDSAGKLGQTTNFLYDPVGNALLCGVYATYSGIYDAGTSQYYLSCIDKIIHLAEAMQIQWSSTTAYSGTADVAIARGGPGILTITDPAGGTATLQLNGNVQDQNNTYQLETYTGLTLGNSGSLLWTDTDTTGTIDTTITRAMPGVVRLTQTLSTPSVTPLAVSGGSTNDWNPGPALFLRLKATTAATITGMVAGDDGQLCLMVNTSGSTITLTNQDSGSAANNQWLTWNGLSLLIPPAFVALAIYDANLTGSNGGWRVSLVAPSKAQILPYTFASTVYLTLGASDWHSLTLTGNCTLVVFNEQPNQQFTLVLTQGGAGGFTVTWFSGIRWSNGTVPTLSTGAGKTDVFTFKQIATGSYLGFQTGQNM